MALTGVTLIIVIIVVILLILGLIPVLILFGIIGSKKEGFDGNMNNVTGKSRYSSGRVSVEDSRKIAQFHESQSVLKSKNLSSHYQEGFDRELAIMGGDIPDNFVADERRKAGIEVGNITEGDANMQKYEEEYNINNPPTDYNPCIGNCVEMGGNREGCEYECGVRGFSDVDQ